MNWMQKEWKSLRNWAESATFVMPSWRRVIAMKKRAGIPKFPRNPAQTTFIIISINSLTHTLVSFHSPSDIHALFVKMGKVHGSLARAGKVKGQTPKVEKQEDSKKMPRGRAKKRLQYNRRYVNVVTGMGGKRVGPNSNADKMK